MTAIANLPSIDSAQLPALYENAKEVLANCERIDECKDWADKAAALASYARQSEDESLQNFAMRIRARAIRRCGELLQEVKPSTGGRPSEKLVEAAPQVSRTQAANDAGMSRDQKVQALRVAAVEHEVFEASLALPKPKTVTELADIGKRPAPRPIEVSAAPAKPRPLVDLGGRAPADFTIATEGMGHVRTLAGFAERVRPNVVVRGALEHETAPLMRRATLAIAWLSELISELEADDDGR